MRVKFESTLPLKTAESDLRLSCGFLPKDHQKPAVDIRTPARVIVGHL